MFRLLYRALAMVKHAVLSLRNNRGFGVQSPFAYALLKEAIHSKHAFYDFKILRETKMALLRSDKVIETEDFGSKGYKKEKKRLNEIVYSAVKPTKQQELFYALVNHLKPKSILELGTSVGLTTAYLAMVDKNATVVSIEACHATAMEAAKVWKKLGINNITLIEDTFENKLEMVLGRMKSVDFVFIDGNHKGEALERYFNAIVHSCSAGSTVIVDDIYWSKDMQNSWKVLLKHPAVAVSFNLFHFGILILNAKLTPGHYRACV